MLNLSTKVKNKIIKKQILTLGTCVKIVLNDGRKIGFTTHVSNVRFIEEPDVVYYCKGFTPTVVSQNNEMSVDNAEGTLIIDDQLINEDDLEKGLYNNAYYELFDFDWSLKTKSYYSYADIIPGINGTIGEVKRGKNQFTTNFRSLAQFLAITIIDTYKATCNASLGDTRCGVNLTSFTFNDTVGAVIRSNQFIVVDAINATGYFNNGMVEFLTGNNKGKKYSIKTWDNTTKIITLDTPVNYVMNAGDSIKLTAGCNKTKSDCKNKFNNYINYRGFYDIPGMDFIVSGGGTKINY